MEKRPAIPVAGPAKVLNSLSLYTVEIYAARSQAATG
jgi:hypothetical protein